MAVIRSFRDLEAWQAAMDLSVYIYSVTMRLPTEERFGLTSQMRRASVSVPSNVAEGQSHGKNGRYVEHVRIAIGSLGELSTELELARRLKFLTSADLLDVERQLVTTRRLLFGLLRSLRKKRLEDRASSKRDPRAT
jgi:four helix bundle protein